MCSQQQTPRSAAFEVYGGPLSTKQPQFSMKRCLWVLLALLCLFVTNPANDPVTRKLFPGWTSKQKRPKPKYIFQIIPIQSVTNFGVFSLTAGEESVELSALQRSLPCPYYDEDIGSVCTWIADTFCHGKPLLHDPNDRPHTAHRILSVLLIASALYSFCCPHGIPFSHPFHGLLSPFYPQAPLLWNLLSTNIMVYPALVELDWKLYTLRNGLIFGLNNANLEFALAVLAMVCLGATCNCIARQITKQDCWGFGSTGAAALGYYTLASSTTTASLSQLYSLFWGYLPFCILASGGSPSQGLSWICAILIGSALGHYHLEHRHWFAALLDL